ncbi:MAG: hypothetical protein OXU20_02660 [Myxococcales bacterium]|nr:hypothetical protein [Myxococcales bacterium]
MSTLSVLLALLACDPSPPLEKASPSSVPPVSNPAPPPPPAPAPPTHQPCAHPDPLALTIAAGEAGETPYGLQIEYFPGVGKIKGLPTFEFRLQHGTRRWRVERTMANWNSRMTWRGFCWKGGLPHPKPNAKKVVIHVAPVCDQNGELLEMGGCRNVLE